MNLFISPHNDDETLFGSFIIQDIKPTVLVVYESHRQPHYWPASGATAQARNEETAAALTELYGQARLFYNLGFRDDSEYPFEQLAKELDSYIERVGQPLELLIYPAWLAGGNIQHNLVARACEKLVTNLFRPCRRLTYLTYTAEGKANHRYQGFDEYKISDPAFITRKLRALACYESQHRVDNCRAHFLRDQNEYYGAVQG